MLIINVKDNETIDRALRRYKRKVKDTNLLKQVKNRKYFEKPSVKRRAEVLKAVHREGLRIEDND